ncbi:MAG TPA: hypothetical protein VHO03_07650 [Ignavibacteriales bacterium]|nr:hypothetical protein [Ignavibacteriales bacterium]
MSKLFFSFFALAAISGILMAQNSQSIQFNAGAVFPMNSSKGFSTTLQYNYSLSQSVQLYAWSGISWWGENHVIHEMDWSEIQTNQFITSYDADEHVLIPLYLGSRFNVHSDKLFTTFLNLELGYSHLSYNAYDNVKVVDENTGRVVEFYADPKTKRKVNENLFGIGAGLGLSREIAQGVELMLFYKLNSFINSNYGGFFTSRGTYNTVSLGINYGI